MAGTIESITAEAEGRFASGDFKGAAYWYRQLMQQAHVIDYEYDDWLRRLQVCYNELENRVAEGLILLHQRENERAVEKFIGVSRWDLAGHTSQAMSMWEKASEHYENSEMVVHQAIALEHNQEFQRAAEIWKSELLRIDRKTHPYEVAIFTYNLGRLLSMGENSSEQGKRVVSDSLRQIEVIANNFEDQGERERAFDCYLILVNVGRQTPQYENLAEGYLNCIRILKEDNLVLYVLQYYEDFVAISLERKEFQAAATLLQEAADYATKMGLLYSKHYSMEAGQAWIKTAEQQNEDGMSMDMVENSFIAALHCFNSLEHWDTVHVVLDKLISLGLSEEKTRRYTKLSTSVSKGNKIRVKTPPKPDYMKQSHAYAEIWIADSIEHELAGDPFQVAVSIVKDLKYPDLIRRRALLVALILLDSEDTDNLHEDGTYEEIARLMGDFQSYTSLKPLEVLLESPSETVRVAVMKALRFLFFKRTFSLTRRGLDDSSEPVKNAALESLKNLNFQQALNPLIRIYFDYEELLIRRAALIAIGRIQSLEGVEFLLKQLKVESLGPLRESVVTALELVDNPDAGRIYQSFLAYENNASNVEVIEKLVTNL